MPLTFLAEEVLSSYPPSLSSGAHKQVFTPKWEGREGDRGFGFETAKLPPNLVGWFGGNIV